ncbi:MAG: TonB-dependent receptor [Sphingomonadales bacterium]|nr:MAG: TonB-dependent receptor [Sphingomonadales bacterium]
MTNYRQLGLAHSCSRAALALASLVALGTAPAFAQTATPAPAPAAASEDQDPPANDQEIVVSGYRAAIASALETKRRANDISDTINAEDIGKFPDANLAESLQRLPGVSIDRDNGEGRTISIRGLGPDFSRVRLNGIEALSTSGANDSGSTPNRSRGFDFNAFASELFSSLTVRKTASAEVDEGSLGATVDLVTGRPFSYKGRKLSLALEDGYYENGKKHNPRIAGLFANSWNTGIGRFGVSFSGAYSKADRVTDSYSRSPASFDYASSRPFAVPTLTAGSPAAGIPQREGFAAPTGTVCNGGTATAPNLNGVIPGINITRLAACEAQRGSNPAAYALLYPNGGGVRQLVNGVTTQTSASSTVLIPGLATLNQQRLKQERLGLTGGFQWQPGSGTLLSVDGVYSRLKQRSDFYQISTIGLNRYSNTGTTYNTATTGSAALYSSCTPTGLVFPIECQGSEGTGAVLPGYANSTNPNNLNVYDYYNNPRSVGYIPTTDGLALLDAIVGRPTTRVIDAHVDNSGGQPVADYLKLGNLDWRSANDANQYTTTFKQVSGTLEQEIGSDMKLTVVAGWSKSENNSLGLLSDLSRLDSGQGVPGNDYYVYDARGGGDMPIFQTGFDAASPNNWDTVKGLSVLRIQARHTENTFKNGRADLEWNAFDNDRLKFGFSYRQFDFITSELRRASNEAVSPTLAEARSSVAATGKVINWGTGLNVPAGTTTSFWAPDNDKMIGVFGFDCDCVNKYGDFRMSYGGSPGLNYKITEKDTGGYVQYDFNRPLFGMQLRGNAGLRFAHTEVAADGLTPNLSAITNSHSYDDWLPSLNAVLEVDRNLIVRFGLSNVIARPAIGQLAPGITSFSVPGTVGAVTGGSISSGNTKLSPFRATNIDFAVEWYFARGALLSFGVFNKDIKSFPQRILAEGRLSDFFDDSVIDTLRASITATTAAGDAQRAYIAADNPFSFSAPLDAPGGYIRGFEVSYQQNLTFLPGFLKNLGVQLNYTHIKSKLTYIIDAGSATRPQQTGDAPFLGASPNSVNGTIFYETPKWSLRGSVAYRSKYFSTYPLQSGTCAAGFCLTPLINDFAGSQPTTNFDASFRYSITRNFSLSLEGLNLTNQTSNRFAYDDNPVVTNYASTGRTLRAGVRVTF